MTLAEGIAWMLVAVLMLIVWDQNRTIWKLLDTVDRTVDLLEEKDRGIDLLIDIAEQDRADRAGDQTE